MQLAARKTNETYSVFPVLKEWFKIRPLQKVFSRLSWDQFDV